MIRLICIDVDGTLVGSSGTVSTEVWDAAERLRERGMHLAICSGRPAFGHTRGLAERLDPTGWHVFQNGASVVRLPSGEGRSRPIAPEMLDWLIERARTTGRILELYTDVDYAVERDEERSRRHAGLLGVPFSHRELRSLRGPIVRAQWLLPIEQMEDVLLEPHEGLTYSASTSPMMPDTGFVNITPPGIDKSHAVRLVAREYGVPLEQVMMVGDGANDVTTMRAVGYAVAMANAEPEARAVARYEVGHVDELGLIDAFELALSLSA
jgi:Cof subfamily protein (haloacid dehalogenase superfamily)